MTHLRGYRGATTLPALPWAILAGLAILVAGLYLATPPRAASRVVSEPRSDYAFRAIVVPSPALAAGTPRPSAIGGVPADAAMTMPVSRPAIQQTAKSEPVAGGLAGQATWYRWRPGEAAAGPALRAALGPGWRGTRVTVCAGAGCVEVRLTDFMASRIPGRLVDLDARAFNALGPLSVGVLRVTVRW